MKKWARIGIAVTLACLATTSAWADETADRANKHIADAEAQFNLGNFAQAAALFKKAYELKPLPELLHNMAQCYKRMAAREHLEKAVHLLRSYLESSPNAPNREAVQAEIKQLRGMIAKLPEPPLRSAPLPVHAESAAKRRSKTILGYTSLGVSIALAVSASIVYGVARSKGDSSHEQYQQATGREDILRFREEVEAANSKITAAQALAGLAGAAACVSVVSFVMRWRETRESPSRATLAPLQGGAVLSFARRF